MKKQLTPEEAKKMFSDIHNSLKPKMKPKPLELNDDINAHLKISVPIEIEHKYLINPEIFKEMYPNLKPKFLSTQAYIQIEEPNLSQLRIATLTYNDYTLPPSKDEIGVINIKGIRVGASRPEFEFKCDPELAKSMITLASKTLQKYRYHFWYDNLMWVADEYLNNNKGLWIAESEIPSEDFEFKIPEFVIKDVTEDERYYNKNLVNNPYCNWRRLSP
jgi:CYTH domain-containing protein